MKQYAEDLVNRLRDQKKWPGIRSAEYFSELQNLAKEAKERRTSDGYLATVLIIHQLSEEILDLLIDESRFYMQLKLYPAPLQISEKKGRMYGQIVSELKSTVWFQNRDAIVKRAWQLNDIRIKIVHELTKRQSLQSLDEEVEEAWQVYAGLRFMALEAHMIFQHEYADYSRDKSWPPEVEFLKDDGRIDA